MGLVLSRVKRGRMVGRVVRTDEGFGNRLKEAMARRGIRPGQLANDLGVLPQTVSRWRRGECPDDLRLPEIAGYLRVGLSWLKEGVGLIEPQAQTEGPRGPVETRTGGEPGSGPTRSPGRRATDRANHSLALASRLAFLRDQLRAYQQLGTPPSADTIEEWLRLTADVMDATRLSDAPARNGLPPAATPPEP